MADEKEPLTDAARVTDAASILRIVQEMMVSVKSKDERSEAIMRSISLLVKNCVTILDDGFLP